MNSPQADPEELVSPPEFELSLRLDVLVSFDFSHSISPEISEAESEY